MLTNLNPPTVPLMLLGVGQVSLLSVLRAPLSSLMSTRAAQAVVFVVGSRAMTVYLWHLPVIVAVAGLSLLVPGAAPEPGEPGVVDQSPGHPPGRARAGVGGLAAAGALRDDRHRRPDGFRRPGAGAIVAAALLAFVPPFAVMQWFLDLPLAVGGAALLAASVILDRARRVGAARRFG